MCSFGRCRQRPQHSFQRQASSNFFEHLIAVSHLVFETADLGDIANIGQDQFAFVKFDQAQTNFDREFVPVAAQRYLPHPRAGRTNLRVLQKSLAMFEMTGAVSFRN